MTKIQPRKKLQTTDLNWDVAAKIIVCNNIAGRRLERKLCCSEGLGPVNIGKSK
jgi:hypothetical protein